MSERERNVAGDRIGAQLTASADAATPRPIDVDAVLVASRARRRSRRSAIVGGVAATAVVVGLGGVVLGLGLVGGMGASTTAGDSSLSEAPAADTMPGGESESAEGDTLDRSLAAPEQVNPCGAPVMRAPDVGAVPLTVTVTAPAAAAAGTSVAALVTVTNASDAPVSGWIRLAPALTVAEAEVAVWHSSGDADALGRSVELAPGASIELAGTFETRRCSADDERLPSLPGDLPALAAGRYGVGAVVAFTDAAHGGAIEYLISPLAGLDVTAG